MADQDRDTSSADGPRPTGRGLWNRARGAAATPASPVTPPADLVETLEEAANQPQDLDLSPGAGAAGAAPGMRVEPSSPKGVFRPPPAFGRGVNHSSQNSPQPTSPASAEAPVVMDIRSTGPTSLTTPPAESEPGSDPAMVAMPLSADSSLVREIQAADLGLSESVGHWAPVEEGQGPGPILPALAQSKSTRASGSPKAIESGLQSYEDIGLSESVGFWAPGNENAKPPTLSTSKPATPKSGSGGLVRPIALRQAQPEIQISGEHILPGQLANQLPKPEPKPDLVPSRKPQKAWAAGKSPAGGSAGSDTVPAADGSKPPARQPSTVSTRALKQAPAASAPAASAQTPASPSSRQPSTVSRQPSTVSRQGSTVSKAPPSAAAARQALADMAEESFEGATGATAGGGQGRRGAEQKATPVKPAAKMGSSVRSPAKPSAESPPKAVEEEAAVKPVATKVPPFRRHVKPTPEPEPAQAVAESAGRSRPAPTTPPRSGPVPIKPSPIGRRVESAPVAQPEPEPEPTTDISVSAVAMTDSAMQGSATEGMSQSQTDVDVTASAVDVATSAKKSAAVEDRLSELERKLKRSQGFSSFLMMVSALLLVLVLLMLLQKSQL